MSLFDEQSPQRQAWSVSGLLLAANDALQVRFGACLVRGEISGFSRAASGHCYFTLRDADGSGGCLRCAMFRRAASLLDFAPRDGQQVELRGRIAVYELRGELQLVVEAMQRLGAGTLYEEFLRLKARLQAQGVFAAERKRPLPVHPRTIGVVTSLGAAALHDVLTALARRAPHVRVLVVPALVQGAEAPASLVAALGAAARHGEADLLILCRGGGSLEDLWSFNDERVVRAVAASPIPVVCGVGHETDITLADLAADLRAPTPTAAAELASPATADLQEALRVLAARAHRSAQRALEGRALRLDRIALRLSRPVHLLARQSQQLQRLDERRLQALQTDLHLRHLRLAGHGSRLARAGHLPLAQARERLGALQARLASLNPRQVLSRGYAWVADESGRPVVSVRGVQTGQTVQAVWADGEATAVLVEVRPGCLDAGA